MLFPYKYVPHQMEQMQRFINFIFYQVWCRAPKLGPFVLTHFDKNPKLQEVMTALNFDHTQAGDKFYGRIEEIYGLFSKLERQDVSVIKRWYQDNNDITHLCDKVNTSVRPVRYSDIGAALFKYQSFEVQERLKNELASFFKNLYDDPALKLAAFKRVIGDIDDHYNALMRVNEKKCPFCGITDMHGIYHSTREAYDHYFPKGLYPFNSINFRNLIPACHHCNSSYKTSKDPAFKPKDPAGEMHRRKAFYPYVFYPYANTGHKIDIKIALKKSDVDKLTHDDIDIDYGPVGLNEKIETWRDVYGIDERYKAKLMDGDGKAWLVEVLDEWKWAEESNGAEGRAPAEFLRDLKRHATKSPFTGANFLKQAFLEGCSHAGLFA